MLVAHACSLCISCGLCRLCLVLRPHAFLVKPPIRYLLLHTAIPTAGFEGSIVWDELIACTDGWLGYRKCGYRIWLLHWLGYRIFMPDLLCISTRFKKDNGGFRNFWTLMLHMVFWRNWQERD